MNSDIKSSKDRGGHSNHIPIVIPAMGASNPFSPELIEELRCGGIDGNSYSIRSGFFHRLERTFTVNEGWGKKDTDRKISFFFESLNDKKGILKSPWMGDH